MFTESRKIELLKDVLATTNEETLVELERVLKTKKKMEKKSNSIFDFVGIISKKEGAKMKEAISVSCETVNPDDWK